MSMKTTTTLLFASLAVTVLVLPVVPLYGQNHRAAREPTVTNLVLKEYPYVESGRLFRPRLDATGGPDAPKSDVANGVRRILSYDVRSRKLLYVTEAKNGQPSALWIAHDSTTAKIYDRPVQAQLSPEGDKVLVWDEDNQIHLIALDGREILRIGTHGASPFFSQDGRLIAYQKLPDFSVDSARQTFFEMSPGIALYDPTTGRESLVTQSQHGDDYAPVGFSADLQRLYFDSARSGVASLWSVNVDGSDLRQLTNNDVGSASDPRWVPPLSQNALWSLDRSLAVSSVDAEIWRYQFSDRGRSCAAKKVANGEQPHWLEQDKSVVFRLNGHWRATAVQ